jgi:hypothetical protein
VGKSRRVLCALGVEPPLEEVDDLLNREWFSLVAGSNRIPFNGSETLGWIDYDEPLFRGEVEDVAQSGQIPLLRDRGERRLAFLFRPRDGLADRQIAIELGPVGREASQDRSRVKTGIVVDGIDGGLIANYFADESYGGPLPIQPLGAEAVDGGILLDQPQVLLDELAERHLCRPTRIEQLVEK